MRVAGARSLSGLTHTPPARAILVVQLRIGVDIGVRDICVTCHKLRNIVGLDVILAPPAARFGEPVASPVRKPDQPCRRLRARGARPG